MATAGYRSETQKKNSMWVLPRPKPDHYKGGYPLYGEEWLLERAGDLIGIPLVRRNRFIGEKTDVLNVFCGMSQYGIRVDLRSEVKPDYVGDIHKLSKFLPKGLRVKVVIADAAYSDKENEELYGHKMHLSYQKWAKECDRYLVPGGLFIVYHKNMMPNPNPQKYTVLHRQAIGVRSGHLLRCAIYFQKKGRRPSTGLEAFMSP